VSGVRVLTGNALTVLNGLPSNFFKCCVTSPPYWGLRDYEALNQVGLESTPREYIVNLVTIFGAVRRTLTPDGVLWVNLGDGFARNGGVGKPGPNAKVGNTKRRIQRRNCRVPEGWKDKDLLGLPWMLAAALREDGWWLRCDVVWNKSNGMPESQAKDRPARTHEYVFQFSKSLRYNMNREGLREPTSCGTGDRGLRSVWTIPTSAGEESEGDRLAPMPVALADRCIAASCFLGDAVLDPFAGSGTTGIAALRRGCQATLIELHPGLARQARQRIRAAR